MAEVHRALAGAMRTRLGDGYAARFGEAEAVSAPAVREADVPEGTALAALADALGLAYLDDLGRMPASPAFLDRVPIGFARRHALMGLVAANGEVLAALADLASWPALENLARALGRPVVPTLAPRAEVLRAVNAAYERRTGQAERVLEALDREAVLREVAGVAASEDLLDVDSRAPVIKLVNLVLFEAVRRGASDVHIQPYADRLVVRLRLDGILYDCFEPPRGLQPEIISRIKIMAGMNIAEQRLPQDGRATVEVGRRVVDLRIATLPTDMGERVVIRLLDKSARLYRLDELGMAPGVLAAFRGLIHTDHGIVLVTGPTGSGKTTTLYGALQEIDATQQNVITLEDPIEYRLEGVSQTQINEKKGLTFARGLRHVLRQDPDIIMVGEVRDGETARMAIQSALTGHLVFSTLHTNDASGAVARMLDLGAEPYLVASSLLGVLAQRLVRRVCGACRETAKATAADLARWDWQAAGLEPPRDLARGRGCEACMETGYSGRVGLFELLTVSEPIRDLVLARGKASSVRAEALAGGMTTLRADGLAKAARGLTTLEEVARVTGRDEY